MKLDDQRPTPRGRAARGVDWWRGGIGHAINRIEELEEWQDRAVRALATSRAQTWRARANRVASFSYTVQRGTCDDCPFCYDRSECRAPTDEPERLPLPTSPPYATRKPADCPLRLEPRDS